MNDDEQRPQRSTRPNLTYVGLDKNASSEEIAAYLHKKGDEILARENSAAEPTDEQ